MPKLTFDESEILADIPSTVNPAGMAYVGRKHKGKKVRVLVMKEKEDR